MDYLALHICVLKFQILMVQSFHDGIFSKHSTMDIDHYFFIVSKFTFTIFKE